MKKISPYEDFAANVLKDTNYRKKSYKTFRHRHDIILNVGAERLYGEQTDHNSLLGITVSAEKGRGKSTVLESL